MHIGRDLAAFSAGESMRCSQCVGRRVIGLGVLAVLLLAAPAARTGFAAQAQPAIEAPAPKPARTPDLQKRIATYRKELAAYKAARAAYDKRAAPYWRAVTTARTKRRRKRARGQTITLDDYVLKQPPLYTGPPEPRDPEAKRKPTDIPVVADFLRHAKAHFGFTPQAPAREIDYKRAYARVAAAAGLTKEACVKIYGFESGGNGKYDVQAGLEYGRPGERAISTALGYNQLLTTNSVGLVAVGGDRFLDALRAKAERASGARRAELQEKIAALANLIRFTRTVENDWYAHGRLAKTEKGQGVHALNLDIDIGPLLQTQKLLDSVAFARRNGYRAPLTAAELEMMNLTGDGSGFDMVTMPAAMRAKVPTSNFFQQGGYERNPVAIRNNTVAKLIAATDAKMETEAKLPGAQELAAAFDGLGGGGE
jgi:hypothetical protein